MLIAVKAFMVGMVAFVAAIFGCHLNQPSSITSTTPVGVSSIQQNIIAPIPDSFRKESDNINAMLRSPPFNKFEWTVIDDGYRAQHAQIADMRLGSPVHTDTPIDWGFRTIGRMDFATTSADKNPFANNFLSVGGYSASERLIRDIDTLLLRYGYSDPWGSCGPVHGNNECNNTTKVDANGTTYVPWMGISDQRNSMFAQFMKNEGGTLYVVSVDIRSVVPEFCSPEDENDFGGCAVETGEVVDISFGNVAP